MRFVEFNAVFKDGNQPDYQMLGIDTNVNIRVEPVTLAVDTIEMLHPSIEPEGKTCIHLSDNSMVMVEESYKLVRKKITKRFLFTRIFSIFKS